MTGSRQDERKFNKKLTATKLPVHLSRALTKDFDLQTPTIDLVELSNRGASSIPTRKNIVIKNSSYLLIRNYTFSVDLFRKFDNITLSFPYFQNQKMYKINVLNTHLIL